MNWARRLLKTRTSRPLASPAAAAEVCEARTMLSAASTPTADAYKVFAGKTLTVRNETALQTQKYGWDPYVQKVKSSHIRVEPGSLRVRSGGVGFDVESGWVNFELNIHAPRGGRLAVGRYDNVLPFTGRAHRTRPTISTTGIDLSQPSFGKSFEITRLDIRGDEVVAMDVTFEYLNQRGAVQFRSEDGVLSNDGAASGTTTEVTVDPKNGTLNLRDDGSFSYTPNPGFTGRDRFYYRLRDEGGYSRSARAVVTVVPDRVLPPVDQTIRATNRTYYLTEGTQLAVEASDFARVTNLLEERTTHSAPRYSTTNTRNFEAVIEDGVISVPYEYDLGRHRVVLRAPLGESLEFGRTYDAVVAGESRPDVATFTNGATNFREGTTGTFRVISAELDADGSVLDLNVEWSFVYRGRLDSARMEYFPGEPLFNPTSPFEAGGTRAVLLGDLKHGSLITQPDGSFLYRPHSGVLDFTGVDSVRYYIADDFGRSRARTLRFRINGVNNAPTLKETQSIETFEDRAVNRGPMTQRAQDSDNRPHELRYELVSSASNGSLTFNERTSAFTYRPDRDFNGRDSFSYRAFDGEAWSNARHVSIRVKPVNDAPKLTVPAMTVLEGSAEGTIIGTLSSSDIDSTTLRYRIEQGLASPLFRVNGHTGDVTVRRADVLSREDLPRVLKLNVSVADTTGGVTTRRLNIRTQQVNDMPEQTRSEFRTAEDVPLVLSISDFVSDPDTPDSKFRVDTIRATHGEARMNSAGQLVYTPSPDYFGPAVIRLRAYDRTRSRDDGLRASDFDIRLNITVSPVIDAPRFVDQTFDVPLDAPVGVTVATLEATTETRRPLTATIEGEFADAFRVIPSTLSVVLAKPLADLPERTDLSVTLTDRRGQSTTRRLTFVATPPAGIVTATLDVGDRNTGSLPIPIDDYSFLLAIVGTQTLTADEIDFATATFGRTGFENSLDLREHDSGRRDYDGDGFADRLLSVRRTSTGLTLGLNTAYFHARTFDGRWVIGSFTFHIAADAD